MSGADSLRCKILLKLACLSVAMRKKPGVCVGINTEFVPILN